MAETLLAARFTLTTHIDKRDLPVYALVRARSDGRPGPRLRPATGKCAWLAAAVPRGETLNPDCIGGLTTRGLSQTWASTRAKCPVTCVGRGPVRGRQVTCSTAATRNSTPRLPIS